MITSIDYQDKTLRKLEVEGNFFNLRKGVYKISV